MTADPPFRLSTYLTLGLACAALGAAEYPIFPEVGGFAALVVIALAVVYRSETRVELLSLQAANNVGIGISLAGAGWAAVRIVRELRVGEFASLGWGVFFVLLLAPVLMAALVAKLLRKEKDTGDYWYLHAAALGAVVLAAAIARRPWEIALLVAYTGAAVWGLTRFALARGGATPAGGRRAGFAIAAGIFATAAAVAAPAFALTPGSPFEKWDFGPGRVEIGFAIDQTVDLNQTGELAVNTAEAFRVEAEEDGRPKDDLPPDTRWRGRVLSHYAHGGWRREATLRLPLVTEPATRAEPWTPPKLGPGEYRLRFRVPGALRSDFLAEPVVWAPRQPAPVADVFDPSRPPRGWYPLPDGTYLRTPGRADRSPYLEYVQYTAPLPDPDLGVGFHLAERGDPVLTSNPVPSVQAFSTRLLAQLIQAGKLPPAAGVVDAVRLRPAEAQHEAVARAFCRHLSESPEYSYTLSLARTRPDLDPVEEFLEHSKTGHCERFASALVLMLRSQGIPAVLVLGFKGHESAGDGKYVIRQDRAHAWATALVSRPDADDKQVWYWLSLDPSPAASGADASQAGAESAGWKWVWEKFFDATPEERLKTLGELAGRPPVIGAVSALLLLTGLLWGVRVVLRTRAGAAAVNPWLAPLLGVTTKYGLIPAAGETPREFAARVSAVLASAPGTAAVAAVPPAWAEAYYEERFGGNTLPPDRRAALDTGLAALRAALSAHPPG
ncbi:MAG TPA: transglutaminaseTgpA domain-containing protein [Urbifossiella sp.]|jgi:transglutaminase-like putative cysteine protease|nr:transglutaminaseTgpA domain-containing protein [Urbifossiella sp.]